LDNNQKRLSKGQKKKKKKKKNSCKGEEKILHNYGQQQQKIRARVELPSLSPPHPPKISNGPSLNMWLPQTNPSFACSLAHHHSLFECRSKQFSAFTCGKVHHSLTHSPWTFTYFAFKRVRSNWIKGMFDQFVLWNVWSICIMERLINLYYETFDQFILRNV